MLNVTLADPVAVLEEDGLRAALLARGCIRILVTLPGHVLKVRHIWPKDLPVKPCIFQVHLRGTTDDIVPGAEDGSCALDTARNRGTTGKDDCREV